MNARQTSALRWIRALTSGLHVEHLVELLWWPVLHDLERECDAECEAEGEWEPPARPGIASATASATIGRRFHLDNWIIYQFRITMSCLIFLG